MPPNILQAKNRKDRERKARKEAELRHAGVETRKSKWDFDFRLGHHAFVKKLVNK